MLKRSPSGERIDKAVKRAVDYETTVADIARRSEKRAWRVAGAASTLALVMAGGLIYLMPHLQKREPYLIMADAYTGTASLARLSSGSEFASMRASEAVNRSNIVHYVLARESYDAGVVNERDWRTVFTMSAPDVRDQVRAERSASNPSSLLSLYGKGSAVRVRILSVTPLGASPGKPPKGATVRFQRLLFEKSTGASRVIDNKLATMEFIYKPDIRMNDADSVENPLRFQVVNYRVDNDAATLVPVEAFGASQGRGRVGAPARADGSAAATDTPSVGPAQEEAP